MIERGQPDVVTHLIGTNGAHAGSSDKARSTIGWCRENLAVRWRRTI
ncbi:hypothetical protein ABGB18_46895 [Nonomuraea sp. B12E4]